MEELEKYLNKYYIESDKDSIFIYKFIKTDDLYGFSVYSVFSDNYYYVTIYEDFPDQDDIEYIMSYIPELDSSCQAKEISEEEYYKIARGISSLKELENIVKTKIKDFVKEYELG